MILLGVYCNASHLLFNRSDLLDKRLSFICSTKDTPFSLPHNFQPSNTFPIASIVYFFVSEGFHLQVYKYYSYNDIHYLFFDSNRPNKYCLMRV